MLNPRRNRCAEVRGKRIHPRIAKQENRRRLDGVDEFAVRGGAIQVVNPDNDIIIDTELRDTDLKAAFDIDIVKQTDSGDNSRAAYNNGVVDRFKLFDVLILSLKAKTVSD